jgi:DNA-binding transcriptional LysR family regulator
MHNAVQSYAGRMDLELRHLRALVAVVDTGTFTDAAAALDVSQASVSRTIAALEEALGARVLHRTTREVSPTVIGVRVVEHARRILDDVDGLQRLAASGIDELRLGYAWAALGRRTTDVLRRWSQAHPDTALLLVLAHTRTAGLAERLSDVAVLRRPVDDARLTSVLVGVEPRYAAVPSADRLARRRAVRLENFAGRTVGVDVLTGSTGPELWRPGAEPGEVRETSGIDEWLTLIEAGLAVGITSEATVHQHPRPGVVFRPVRDAPPIPVSIAWRTDDPPRDVADLVDLVVAAYSTPA